MNLKHETIEIQVDFYVDKAAATRRMFLIYPQLKFRHLLGEFNRAFNPDVK
jgi:hypothetical protein